MVRFDLKLSTGGSTVIERFKSFGTTLDNGFIDWLRLHII
jgi:hypothetical protein